MGYDKVLAQKDVEFVNGKLVVRIDKNEEHELGKKRRRENLELEEKIKNILKDESRHTKLAQTAATSNKNTMLTKKNTISTKFIIIIIVVKKIGKLINSRKNNKKESISRKNRRNKTSLHLVLLFNAILTQSQGFPLFLSIYSAFFKVLNKRYKAQGVKSFEVLMK